MRTLKLVESAPPTSLDITDEQAASLTNAGTRLASSKLWWGQPTGDDSTRRTVITCEPAGQQWRVGIVNVVGMVSIGDLQLEIAPKIPIPHLLYLLGQTGQLPRLDTETAEVLDSDSLIESVARWFNVEFQRVLWSDPIKDYRPMRSDLKTRRGRVHALPTTRNYYSGRTALACEFDEFDTDTPINRVLKAAADAISRSPLFATDTRMRSRRLARHLDDIGRLAPGDQAVLPDQRMGHYHDAHALALQILRSEGLHPTKGPNLARTFLLYTPALVEKAIRKILNDGLGPEHTVSNKGMQIAETGLKLQPDLVIDDGRSVGDIKYKIYNSGIARPDLYQCVAFAAGYQTKSTILISFGQELSTVRIPIGDIVLTHVTWPTGMPPAQAATEVVEAVREAHSKTEPR